ncbi:hypothetical protein [Kitasatospora sp. CMC57]|uniref:hypothetical protein n=1 Tax=Kitasatospora sp. CMC57 TaxID=3231513 RepID=UPI0038B605D5
MSILILLFAPVLLAVVLALGARPGRRARRRDALLPRTARRRLTARHTRGRLPSANHL